MSEALKDDGRCFSQEEVLERQAELGKHLLLAFGTYSIRRKTWIAEWCQARRGLTNDDMIAAGVRAEDDYRFEWKVTLGMGPIAGAFPGSQEEYEMLDFVREVAETFVELEERVGRFDITIPQSVLIVPSSMEIDL